MFAFHWSELLVVVLGGLVLFVGLALVMLRRRNEILKKWLTPEDPDLEEEFFRVRQVPPEEILPEEETADEKDNETEEPAAQWGIQAEEVEADVMLRQEAQEKEER